MHAADDSRGIVESFAQALLSPLQHLGVFFEPFIHVAEHLSQLLLDRLRVVLHGLAQLGAQIADLLLQDEQRRIVAPLQKRL